MELERLVELLVEVPSVSRDSEACARVLQVVRDQVGGGLHMHALEHDGVQSLVYSTRPGRRARVILNAHLDVVPARQPQFSPRRHDGRLEGRGVYDMKGAAAVYVRLLADLAGRPEDARPDLQVQFVTDEEVGGARGVAVLLREGFTGEAFVAGEPTDLGVCHRAKGIVWLTVRLEGRPGHAAMPWASDSPVERLLAGAAEVRRRWPLPADEAWTTTASLTGLRAGEAHNRIPQHAEIDLDIRRIPRDDPDEIIAFVQRVFPGGEIGVKQIGDVLDTPADDPWVRRVVDLQTRMLGASPRLYGEHYGSDARFYSAAGVSAFCWGPRGGGMHADDEWLDVASLHDYDRMVRALAGV